MDKLKIGKALATNPPNLGKISLRKSGNWKTSLASTVKSGLIFHLIYLGLYEDKHGALAEKIIY